MADCQYCAEELAGETEQCPHCGERQVVEREVPDSDKGVWQGQTLIIPLLRAHVRARGCVLCAVSNRSVQPRQRQFVHSHPVFGRTRVTAYLPLCAGCDQRWRLGHWIVVAMALLGLLGIPLLSPEVSAALALAGARQPQVAGPFATCLAWIAATISLRFWIRRRLQVRCVLVEGQEVSLAFPDPEVARRVIHAV